jgi:hypothetical protein
MTAFATAARTLFGNTDLTTAAVWTPAGGDAVALRLMLRRADQVQEWGETAVVTEARSADIRTADAPTLAAGDAVAIGDDSYVVQGQPVRDTLSLVWTVTLVPA